MQAYIARRLIQVIFVLFGVSTMMFVLLRLSGDPTALFISDVGSAEEIARVRESMGFNDPMYVQYGRFIGDIATGDFGQSFRAKTPAMDLVLQRLPATLELAIVSLIVGILLAIPSGVLAAVYRGTIYDTALTIFLALGQAVPIFLLAFLLIYFFAVRWGIFPTSGRGELQNLVLPGLTIGLFFTARIARITRSSVLEVLNEGYVMTARAKGLSNWIVLSRHVLRNAGLPILTVIGHLFAIVISGAIVTETVFAWPGIGRLMVESVRARDFPVVQASVFVVAVLVAFLNLATDVAYTFLDPRVRLR